MSLVLDEFYKNLTVSHASDSDGSRLKLCPPSLALSFLSLSPIFSHTFLSSLLHLIPSSSLPYPLPHPPSLIHSLILPPLSIPSSSLPYPLPHPPSLIHSLILPPLSTLPSLPSFLTLCHLPPSLTGSGCVFTHGNGN